MIIDSSIFYIDPQISRSASQQFNLQLARIPTSEADRRVELNMAMTIVRVMVGVKRMAMVMTMAMAIVIAMVMLIVMATAVSMVINMAMVMDQ